MKDILELLKNERWFPAGFAALFYGITLVAIKDIAAIDQNLARLLPPVLLVWAAGIILFTQVQSTAVWSKINKQKADQSEVDRKAEKPVTGLNGFWLWFPICCMIIYTGFVAWFLYHRQVFAVSIKP